MHEVTGEGGSFDLNHVVCGTINAKNGFGGYVGTAPFIGFLAISRDKPPRFKLSDLGSPDNYYTITKRCREHGVWP
ncbi:hypothetical protein ACSBOB_18980 [Mesorhizobium sp. ASY16-5R]|uniref:hypothetical protein n=1 Tax=Mesorhizobium sp. ASY16-5R TaxID=3445772 RepID=UPI003F9F730D